MKILVADPAKNITVFVLDPVEDPAGRSALAGAIMSDERIRAEQVGFIIPPDRSTSSSGAALWRLEMADGEFCGNATRSFGLYVARAEGFRGRRRLFVSVSGMKEPVQTEADTELNWAAAEMPGPALVDTLEFDGRSLPVLVFEGITHVIAPDLEAERDRFFAIKAILDGKFSDSSFSAIGVMFYDTKNRYMRPAVYVPSTNNLVFESSCGSGSAALGAWLCREQRNGIATYAIKQPGGIIETEVEKREGQIRSISIGGKVEFGTPEDFPYERPFL